jgi:predicted nucleotidyltransferase
MTKQTAIRTARKFVKECKALPISIDRAILFGSTVQGNSHKDSDIDLALFSENFGENILKNIDLIGKVNIRYPEIDVHTFNTSEQKKRKGILMEQILKTGVEIDD